MSLTLTTLGGKPLTAVSVRLLIPWIGPWLADVDVDLGTVATIPKGPCVLQVGESILSGTIDSDRTSKLGDFKAHVRVVAGANGWSQSVGRLPYHMDGGVLLAQVLSTTAAAVKELPPVLVNPTERVGIDYVRFEGPASQVLSGREWHVDLTGVTFVGPRLPIVLKPGTLDIQDWDGISHRLSAASTEIVLPGTVVVDTRIGTGTTTIRTVEQTWSAEGSKVTAWCSTDPPEESNPVLAPLANLIDHRIRRPWCVPQLYRIVTQEGSRLVLQAVSKKAGAPDMIPLSVWPGMAGLSAMHTLGSEVLVSFIDGDPTRPAVSNFKDGNPIELKLDATTFVTVGGPMAGSLVTHEAFMALFNLMKTAIGAAGPTGPAAVTALESAALAVLPLLPTKKLKAE